MVDGIVPVAAPQVPLYRVGRAPDSFALPPWAYSGADGTFGGRFDDPRRRLGRPAEQHYRVLYLATDSAGAFGETIARFRPDLAVLANLPGPASITRLERPAVPAAWRQARRFGATIIDPGLVLADLGAAETMQDLRGTLAAVALDLGLPDVDVSALTGPRRRLTQEVARYLYEQQDDAGRPRFHGLRYLSHYNVRWECWALFADRLAHRVVRVDPIAATTAGLIEAARVLQLRIEEDGRGRYVTP